MLSPPQDAPPWYTHWRGSVEQSLQILLDLTQHILRGDRPFLTTIQRQACQMEVLRKWQILCDILQGCQDAHGRPILEQDPQFQQTIIRSDDTRLPFEIISSPERIHLHQNTVITFISSSHGVIGIAPLVWRVQVEGGGPSARWVVTLPVRPLKPIPLTHLQLEIMPSEGVVVSRGDMTQVVVQCEHMRAPVAGAPPILLPRVFTPDIQLRAGQMVALQLGVVEEMILRMSRVLEILHKYRQDHAHTWRPTPLQVARRYSARALRQLGRWWLPLLWQYLSVRNKRMHSSLRWILLALWMGMQCFSR